MEILMTIGQIIVWLFVAVGLLIGGSILLAIIGEQVFKIQPLGNAKKGAKRYK